LVPEGLTTQFGAARAGVEAELARLGGALQGFDPGLEKAFARSQAKMLYQLGKMERKTAREAMRRDERATADARRLHDMIYPHRHMQERLFGILPFLATHGMDLAARVHSAVEPGCPDHQVLSFD
jgi:uncharacterized protein YllA (UPF0747 family)